MKIGQFRGISGSSRAIRFITRSNYSHSCFVFDEQTVKAIDAVKSAGIALPKIIWPCRGAVVEAWATGLRNVSSISDQHDKNTQVDLFDFMEPLTMSQEMSLVRLIHGDIGDKYGFWNVLKFVTKRPGKDDETWFCSEHVSERCRDIEVPLFNNTESWEVPPDWIPRSRALNPVYKTVFTS